MIICSVPYVDPLAAFGKFANDTHAALLDGAAQAGNTGISYIAADPFSIIEADQNGVIVDGRRIASDPFAALERELGKYAEEPFEAPVPFAGGALGFFGYELGGWLERLLSPRPDTPVLPSMAIGLYDTIAAFDHVQCKTWILSTGWPEQDFSARRSRAERRAENLARKIAQVPEHPPAPDWMPRGVWHAELERGEAEWRIERIIEYIRAGDIFQANFTQRFRAARPENLSDFMLYRRLRALAPAPFAAFLKCGPELSIASVSPERFLRLRPGSIAETYPIKGTRPRDINPARDVALADELKNSAKDHAENLMIVDLMRNDLARVCEPGSVNVPRLCELESFASVHHLVSAVTGRLQPDVGPVDLLRACFPGGSVTGAPKIRAMEIIRELEPVPRGPYCGCFGWIGFDGTMDMSMTIRTLVIAGKTVFAQAGGGIVADSSPAAEYEESMTKIAPLLRALAGP